LIPIKDDRVSKGGTPSTARERGVVGAYLGPVLGREEADAPIRYVVGLRNAEGTDGPRVIFDVPDEGAAPDIPYRGAAEAFDPALERLEVIFEVLTAMGNAAGTPVVHTNPE
jgi:hypothetical protein